MTIAELMVAYNAPTIVELKALCSAMLERYRNEFDRDHSDVWAMQSVAYWRNAMSLVEAQERKTQNYSPKKFI